MHAKQILLSVRGCELTLVYASLFPDLQTCHVFCSVLLSSSISSLFAALFKLCKLSFVYSECSRVRVPVCEWVCTRACVYALRIVSTHKILRFIDTLIIIIIINTTSVLQHRTRK